MEVLRSKIYLKNVSLAIQVLVIFSFIEGKRTKIAEFIFEELQCDVQIGSDPLNYPQTHGEYFFHRLPP